MLKFYAKDIPGANTKQKYEHVKALVDTDDKLWEVMQAQGIQYVPADHDSMLGSNGCINELTEEQAEAVYKALLPSAD